jgi:bifunctional non-homologous end joining protein LigD
LLQATREQGLEGVVAKRRRAHYRPGVRNSDWLKLAHRRHQVAVIGGWRPEVNDQGRIGALLIGIWTEDLDGGEPRFSFAGRVGSGLVAAGPQADLHRLLKPLEIPRSPFADRVPREDAKGTTWVEPAIVIEVRHLGRTEGGRLRQPVFRGIRTDVAVADVRVE